MGHIIRGNVGYQKSLPVEIYVSVNSYTEEVVERIRSGRYDLEEGKRLMKICCDLDGVIFMDLTENYMEFRHQGQKYRITVLEDDIKIEKI